MSQPKISKERFSLYINKKPSGCWEWNKSKNKQGYGRGFLNGRKEFAHRLSWILYKGKIPKGLLVCHTCDNPPCCNPKHLFLGTHKDNFQDMVKKGRRDLSAIKGEIHVNSKLTELEVREIHALRLRTEDIAEKYKVSVQTVYVIKSGNGWKHLGLGHGAYGPVCKGSKSLYREVGE